MEIANSKHRGSRLQLGAVFIPEFGPAIERGPHEWKYGQFHLGMLVLKVRLDDSRMVFHPLLVFASALDDCHDCPQILHDAAHLENEGELPEEKVHTNVTFRSK
jgi:hypothetical protein